jgi:RecA-family ATPase
MSDKQPDANEVLQRLGVDGLRQQLDEQRRPYLVKPANEPGTTAAARTQQQNKKQWNWREWSITAAALQCKQFPEIGWVLEGILPEGLTLLVGKPKVGKSWLALELSLGVADGGFVMTAIRPACTGDVLYLALEDNQRRLQKRSTKLRGALKGIWPARLTLVTQWRRLDKGGLEDIVEWCDSVVNPRLIVIDTLQKIKPIKSNAGYAEDYDALQALQQFAGERGIAILILHHQRKMEADDPLDTVSGTLGLAGSADTTLVLNRTAQGITLYGRGRDIEEFERAMQFDRGSCRWRLLGDAEELHRSRTRAKILEVLTEEDRPMTPKEIKEAAKLDAEVVKQRLRAMVEKGEVVKLERSKYAHRDYVPPVTIVTSVTKGNTAA